MDLSALIVVISLTTVFFGFIVFLAIYSRRNNLEESPDGKSKINFSEVKKQNEQYLKKRFVPEWQTDEFNHLLISSGNTLFPAVIFKYI